MNEERETVITKIEKLLRKAESSEHEAERDAFHAKAADLMHRHAVEEAELRMAGGVTEEVEQQHFTYSGSDSNLPGKRALLEAACKLTGCKFLYYTGSRHKQVSLLVGFPSDIAACKLAYSSFFLQARTAGSRAGFATKKEVTSYMRGFAWGLINKIDEVLRLRADDVTPGVGLVLADRSQEVQDSIDSLNPDKVADNYRADVVAEMIGGQDGARADIGLGQVSDHRDRTALDG